MILAVHPAAEFRYEEKSKAEIAAPTAGGLTMGRWVKQLKPLPLDEEFDTSAIAAAPNPKPSTSDKQGYGSLASLYTAFSSEFARYALEMCVAEGHRRIADCFSGMGTLGEAGRGLPVTITLNDLNPFASLSGVFRTSRIADLAAAVERVAEITIDTKISEREAFLAALKARRGDGPTPLDLLNAKHSSRERALLLDVHLLSLIRIASHRRLRGSNPTWTKRSSEQPLEPSTLDQARSTVLGAARNYIKKLEPLSERFTATCLCGDVAGLNFEDGELDAVVTSPPYPNRTDYIRHYLSAAELLIDGDVQIERGLREVQIGTPLIRTSLPDVELPAGVLSVIERVRNHKSYASERYYAKGFLYYFADMRRVFERTARWLRPGGLLILVVQDTYYKEMRIPVADLLTEIAEQFGLLLEGRKDFPVKQALSRLSAQARAATPTRPAVESAVCLRRISK